MSSFAVRVLCKAWARALDVEFVDTITRAQHPSGQWVTLEFLALGTQQTTLCGEVEELGMVTLVFFDQPGAGEETLIAVAEAQALKFSQQVDPAGRVFLETRNPAELYGLDTPFLAVAIPIPYIYRRS
jgi:hypothetical protein